MTIDELLEYGKEFSDGKEIDKKDIDSTMNIIKREGINAFEFDNTSLSTASLVVVWFTKKGFDLFGLIESKQAIDKTTLKL